MAADDIVYYQQRAEAELELAQRARLKAHYELANAYLDRIHAETAPAEG